MFKIKTLNAISDVIHEELSAEQYVISPEEPVPEGNLVRSAVMHDAPLNPEGILAGTHSSPIAWMTAVKDRIRWLSRRLEEATREKG